jgi:hypothetical protein
MRRYWINQASTLQPYHKLHGKKVLANEYEVKNKKICTCYFYNGDIISQKIHTFVLELD